jgi:hypothetical protein
MTSEHNAYEWGNERDDGLLDLIYSLIEEANQVHIQVMTAGTRRDPVSFDHYNRLNQIDEEIEVLSQIRSSGKYRSVLTHYRH